jgi:four helix bundle protein
VGANIVEAWHKRRYEAQFVYKLTDADAELAETEHWLETALACHYIESTDRDRLVADAREIGRMIGAMIAHPDAWSRPYR